MTTSKRVLHIGAGNLFGGVESLLLTFARERATCPSMEPAFAVCFHGRLGEELERAGTPPVYLPSPRASRPWTVWGARRALATYLERHRPAAAVCHAPWAHAMFAPVAVRAGLPTVFWQHGPASGAHWLERWARRTAPTFAVSTSQYAAGSLAALFPDTPHAVIHPPVPRPPSDPSARQRLRSAMGAAGDDVVIVMVARMEGLKGHDVLIDAFQQLRNTSTQCWIVGGAQRREEQEYLAGLERRRAGNDRVRLLGERHDVPALLAAADIYAQPNVAPDAFGITFIEALDAKLPVVTSALGGAVEIVNDTCGILVPPRDASALAAALERLAKDATLRRTLGIAGPTRAAELTDPSRQLARLSAIVSSLALPS